MNDWITPLLDLTGITTVINHHLKLSIHQESEFMHIPPWILTPARLGSGPIKTMVAQTFKNIGGKEERKLFHKTYQHLRISKGNDHC